MAVLKNALKQLVTGDNYSAVLDLTRSIATASQLSPKAAQGSANSNGAGYALVAARSGGEEKERKKSRAEQRKRKRRRIRKRRSENESGREEQQKREEKRRE